jgi:hypothetical protein
VKKNVEAYWAIKDSAGRRTAAENIKSLSESFGDLYMIQYTLAYEIDQIEYASSTTPRDARLITREFSTLTAAFYDLANESMETAKLMRQYADTMKR